MGKDLKGKELGVGITQQKTVYIMQALLISWAKGGLSVLKSYKNVESGLLQVRWRLYNSIKILIFIIKM